MGISLKISYDFLLDYCAHRMSARLYTVVAFCGFPSAWLVHSTLFKNQSGLSTWWVRCLKAPSDYPWRLSLQTPSQLKTPNKLINLNCELWHSILESMMTDVETFFFAGTWADSPCLASAGRHLESCPRRRSLVHRLSSICTADDRESADRWRSGPRSHWRRLQRSSVFCSPRLHCPSPHPP